jgi:glycosyltransferase involved in cell wall biosynthesis
MIELMTSAEPSFYADDAPHRDTWVVIPLFNEASVIGDIVHELKTRFANIVCIDDGSHDGSGSIARKAGARLVQHPINLGQGAALQTGFDYALQHGAEYVVTFDADGQHRVEDAEIMVRRAQDEDLAIVVGSRFLDDRTRPGFLRSSF